MLLTVDFFSTLSHPSPNQEPTNSERKLVCGDWHPSENTDHPTHFSNIARTPKKKLSSVRLRL